MFGPLSGQAEIKTTTPDPIYSKNYPYPVAMRDEIEKQISELLTERIIRPSNSPYNSPIWVMPKQPKPNGDDWQLITSDLML